MVQSYETQQAFDDTCGHGPVTTGDVCLVVDRTVGDEEVAARLEGVELLPDYVAEAGRRLYLWRGADRVSEDEFMRVARRITSAPSREEDRARSIATLRLLAREAFELCALLTDEDGFDCDAAALARFHAEARPAATGRAGAVDYVAAYHVPPCSYLQYLWDGCERVSAPPINADAYVVPEDRADGYDVFCGWVGSKAGGRLEVALREAPDDEGGRRAFLATLAKALLDIHLSDIQVATYGTGHLATMARHAVAALWLAMARSVDSDHVGTCHVCGRPFVATNERRVRTRYCQTNGACSKAYARTRQALGLVAEGRGIEEAVAEVRNISTRRVLEVVRRNRHALRAEFPTVDLDALVE